MPIRHCTECFIPDVFALEGCMLPLIPFGVIRITESSLSFLLNDKQFRTGARLQSVKSSYRGGEDLGVCEAQGYHVVSIGLFACQNYLFVRVKVIVHRILPRFNCLMIGRLFAFSFILRTCNTEYGFCLTGLSIASRPWKNLSCRSYSRTLYY